MCRWASGAILNGTARSEGPNRKGAAMGAADITLSLAFALFGAAAYALWS